MLVNDLVECNSSEYRCLPSAAEATTGGVVVGGSGGGGKIESAVEDPQDRKTRGLAIQRFLDESASQITYYGLQCLYETVKDR